MSDIFIAFLVLRYIITYIEKDIIPIIHSSTDDVHFADVEKLFVCKQASNFCLNTLEFISSVQLVGEVGENEGTHHLIEARARYVVSLSTILYTHSAPQGKWKKKGLHPNNFVTFNW